MLPSLIFTSGIAASRLRAATTQELFGVNTYPAIFTTDATDGPDRKWRAGGREGAADGQHFTVGREYQEGKQCPTGLRPTAVVHDQLTN